MEKVEQQRGIATTRSREAEMATEAAADVGTGEAHRHAFELHREAASWHRKVEQAARAEQHEVQAQVHARLAALIEDEGAEALGLSNN